MQQMYNFEQNSKCKVPQLTLRQNKLDLEFVTVIEVTQLTEINWSPAFKKIVQIVTVSFKELKFNMINPCI